MIKKWPS